MLQLNLLPGSFFFSPFLWWEDERSCKHYSLPEACENNAKQNNARAVVEIILLILGSEQKLCLFSFICLAGQCSSELYPVSSLLTGPGVEIKNADVWWALHIICPLCWLWCGRGPLKACSEIASSFISMYVIGALFICFLAMLQLKTFCKAQRCVYCCTWVTETWLCPRTKETMSLFRAVLCSDSPLSVKSDSTWKLEERKKTVAGKQGSHVHVWLWGGIMAP